MSENPGEFEEFEANNWEERLKIALSSENGIYEEAIQNLAKYFVLNVKSHEFDNLETAANICHSKNPQILRSFYSELKRYIRVSRFWGILRVFNHHQVYFFGSTVVKNYNKFCKYYKENCGEKVSHRFIPFGVYPLFIPAFVLFAVVGAGVAYPILINVEKKDKVDVYVEKDEQTISYGENVDLKQFKAIGHAILGNRLFDHSDEIDYSMITYDPELIGTQACHFTFRDKTVGFSLTIVPKQLDVPNPVFNNSTVTWDAVPGATYYEISINDKSYIFDNNSYSLAGYTNPGNLIVKVRSYSDSEKYLSSSFALLPTLTVMNYTDNITYDGNTFSWDAVEGAVQYNLSINDTKVVAITNSYAFNNFKEDANVINITAIGGQNTIPSKTISKTYTKLHKITNLFYHVSSTKVMWSYDKSEATFDIYVDGTFVASTGNLYYDYPLDFSCEHIIKVCARSIKEEYIKSDFESIEIPVRQLAKPDVSIKLGSYADTYKIEVAPVDNADRYDLSLVQVVDSVEYNYHYVLTSQMYKEITIKPGANKIIATVYAIDSSGYYLDSQSATVERDIS